ncbi:MAG: hypothetical protein ACI9LV_000665 [Candidatus Nanohaloarchaea archaeon]|jgi:hypothetical protein
MSWEYEIPESTAAGFLEKHIDSYSRDELRLMGELADEVWFRAREEKIEQDAEFRARSPYGNPEFTPESKHQEDLTIAIEDELGLGIFESSQLAADLMRDYTGTAEGANIEVQGDTYHL